MNLKRTFPRLFVLIALLLSSCAHVKINDQEWCGDMGSEGAACFHTLNDKTREINETDWDNERFGMVCTKAVNFGELKAAVEKLCALSKRCTYEDKELAKKFFRRVERFR